MIAGFAILAGFAVLLLLMGWLGAESRPDFLDPTKKHRSFSSLARLGK
jgi:hypothetical protein